MREIWFGHDNDGYEQLSLPYHSETVTVHQLLAVANGYDPYKVWSDGEFVTHHKSNIPWDNRPENVEVVSKGEHNRIHKPREEINKEKCASIRNSNLTISELSEKYECSNGAIAKHIYGECTHFSGPARSKQDGPRDGPWRDKETFYKKYINEDMTLSDIADLWNASKTTMSNWKRKHGIEK